MKKLVVVLSFILTVSLIGCGKDAEPTEPESAEEALERIEEDLNAVIEADKQETEEKEEQGYPEGVIPDGEYICPDATQVLSDMGNLKFSYRVESGNRTFIRGIYHDRDIGSYSFDVETETYQFDVYKVSNGENVHPYQFEGYMDDSGNLIVTHVKTEDEEYSDLEWVYVRQ